MMYINYNAFECFLKEMSTSTSTDFVSDPERWSYSPAIYMCIGVCRPMLGLCSRSISSSSIIPTYIVRNNVYGKALNSVHDLWFIGTAQTNWCRICKDVYTPHTSISWVEYDGALPSLCWFIISQPDELKLWFYNFLLSFDLLLLFVMLFSPIFYNMMVLLIMSHAVQFGHEIP